ncbi:ABC transporter ATP-binding protein [Shouchella lonarensis]|uniref:Putative ABC transport system ATP-binding protein n=1 Tax=Shouchella lonarensis TaxID=1464122 RepID=A0A1G6K4Z9_9BACI|nr:ABC transporter ATP-binding protein [Shouchella lonarensis]SDC26080.1 putative ABC transport system ATP-binding protein [Shouchella lonarensis]
MIELKRVTKSFKIGQTYSQVLSPLDLTIEEGSFMTIMGPSGSGKSTLMNIIGCLDKPTTGAYLLDGQNIGAMSERQLAKIRNEQIGFVFQQFHLLPKLSAWKNVELPLVYAGMDKRERYVRAHKALAKVGLLDWADYVPASLSGGQKQRVAIARALVNEPTIILADEPTGALDTKTSVTIMELLQSLNESGTTIAIITHEPEVAEWTNRTVFVRDGQIQEVPAS